MFVANFLLETTSRDSEFDLRVLRQVRVVGSESVGWEYHCHLHRDDGNLLNSSGQTVTWWEHDRLVRQAVDVVLEQVDLKHFNK